MKRVIYEGNDLTVKTKPKALDAPEWDVAAQRFAEACLADKGYRFVRKDGTVSVWRSVGFRSVVEARVDGTGKVEYITEPDKRCSGK